MKPDILALGAFPDATLRTLAERFTSHHTTIFPPPAEMVKPIAPRIRALATEVNRGATRELIAALPNLEIIACFGVGLDKIDLAAARERNIPVTNTPGVVGEECADLAIGLMLASARQIVFADRFVREGSWAKGPLPLGRSVGRKTLGVVGLGGIGRAIAQRAAAFDMTVLYHGPRRKADAPYEYVDDIVALARRSDYLMVACEGGAATRHLVSREVIEALGPSGTLINIARGTVVDERAMIDALATGRLGWAALDVYEGGTVVPPELLALPNVIVQPHQGSATVETRTRIGALMIDNLSAHFAGLPLPTPVT